MLAVRVAQEAHRGNQRISAVQRRSQHQPPRMNRPADFPADLLATLQGRLAGPDVQRVIDAGMGAPQAGAFVHRLAVAQDDRGQLGRALVGIKDRSAVIRVDGVAVGRVLQAEGLRAADIALTRIAPGG